MKYSFFFLLLIANIIAYAQPGTLDYTFNGTGISRTSFWPGTNASGGASTIQGDGKIVIVGKLNSGVAAITRVNANGSIDSTYDNDGIATLALTNSDLFTSVSIQSDGKIVAVGQANAGSGLLGLIVRYNSDGSLDTTFNGDGVDTVSNPYGGLSFNSVAIQADDKIIAAGQADNSSFTNLDIILYRFNTDGSLDTTFNGAGMVTSDFGGDDFGYSVKIMADGRIVVGGETDSIFNPFRLVLSRYNTNGSIDNSFNNDGMVTTLVNNTDAYAAKLAIQPDGKIVMAATSEGLVDYDYAILRYNVDGSLDTTFNTTGISFNDLFAANDEAIDVAIQNNGKIIVTGNVFAALRLNQDGSIDSTFGVNGITLPCLCTGKVAAVHILDDSKIILTGYIYDSVSATNTLTAMRLLNEGMLSGTVYNDIDSNGIQGTNENGIGGQLIKIEPGPFYTVSNINGYYYYPVDSGVTYTLSYVPNQYWAAYNNTLSHSVTTVNANTNFAGLDFAIHPAAINVDVRISVSAARFRCSSESTIWVDYRNYGTTTENGRVELAIDAAQTFVSSIPSPDSVAGNQLFWYYNNFTPYAYGHIEAVVTNPGFAAIGDTLSVVAYVLPDSLAYSYSEQSGVVFCSFDPNDKNVQPREGEENYVLHNTQLEYLIRFQNTGNDIAFDVAVTDTIDDNLDISTLKILGYSHPMTFSIEGQNVVVFRFNNIMLPDSNVNELSSHGYVKYTIKPKAGLADNTVVENTAYIYFDNNPAVITNTIHSTYVSEIIVSVSEQKESDVKIYPNPTTGLLHITATESEIEKVMVHSITGKEVITTPSTIIDLNTQPDGVYFITIVTNNGVATKKVMVAR